MDGEHGQSASAADRLITRRALIARGLLGAAGLAVLPSVLAACNGSGGSPQPSQPALPTPVPATPTPTPTPLPTATAAPPRDFLAGKLTGNLTVGSQFSDPPTATAMQTIDAAFATETGVAPVLNTIEHGTCADTSIFSACVGTPGDVLSWFPGFRMRQFAAQGLLAPIDDVWPLVKDNLPPGFAATVTGGDGHLYGLPFDYYPWLFFYRKSLWQARGYEIPNTWDALLALCVRMKKDGLTPVAFSDKDGWPAMATFDMLDLRLNGYDFHMGLLTGAQKWTDSRVTTVFETWRQLAAYYPPNSANLTWQDAAASLVRKKAGMFYLGTFMSPQVPFIDPSGEALADLDAFPFPFFGNDFDAERAIEAPADAWLIASKSPNGAVNLDNARAYLQFWGKGSTQLPMARAAGTIPTALDADVSGLGSLLARAAPFVAEARRITQFMDRDTRPDFAGGNGMQAFLLEFIENPSRDTAPLQKKIQDFWDSLPSLD